MKKIKIMAICTSLIIGFSSSNAEEKKPYVNGTMVTFDSFINTYYEKEDLKKFIGTCDDESKGYMFWTHCKQELLDSLKTKKPASKECEEMGKKVKGHIIVRNVDTINPNQKDEKEMVNFFLKSTEDYLKFLHCE